MLEKSFSYRRSKEGWAGLVSEPVKITWKKGKDLTEGLTDDAVALFEARKKKGDFMAKDLPEYEKLKKQVEHLNGAGTSFFTWFGFVSGFRYVTAEESEEATKEHQKKKEERKAGKKEDEKEDDEEEEDDDDDSDVEVHEAGEELATVLAEELWPNAIKFFTGVRIPYSLKYAVNLYTDFSSPGPRDRRNERHRLRRRRRDGRGRRGRAHRHPRPGRRQGQ